MMHDFDLKGVKHKLSLRKETLVILNITTRPVKKTPVHVRGHIVNI